jgi:hypothetical protein
MERTETCIKTRSGRWFDILNPRPESVFFDDIAYALSNICRFTGHTSPFYSVGEHAYNMSYLVGDDPYVCMAALHHDDSEAITNDISAPMKRAFTRLGFDFKNLIERPIQLCIERALFPYIFTENERIAVKKVDIAIRFNESHIVMQSPQQPEHELPVIIKPIGSRSMTRRLFTRRHEELSLRISQLEKRRVS